ncbi:Cell wall protein phiA [Colletotrichum tanaceti]|nr:Cell wall protein phiA [Colletotrichum tanaceti]
MALRPSSPVHYSLFQAARGNIFLNLPNQNATCDNGQTIVQEKAATFALNPDGGLYLYRRSPSPQQIYADLSGMGQGKLGYTIGAQPPPRNAEETGWAVGQDGQLTLRGFGFIACPGAIENSWSVWMDTGRPNPGGNAGCVGVPISLSEVKEPSSCDYTF